MNITVVAVRTMRRAVPFFLCFFLVACMPTITRREYDQKCKEFCEFAQHAYWPGLLLLLERRI